MQMNDKISIPAEKKSLFDPALIFLIIGLLVGILYCVVIPYGAGFDEEAHLVRIYDISGNNLLPNHNPPTYKNTLTYSEFHNLSYQRRDFQSPAFDIFTKESLAQKLSRQEKDILYGYTTNSIYSPVIFLPQAVVARIFWRNFDFPIIPVIMMMRLAGLLLYVLASYFAIRLLPRGKWALMALALSPMALFQAATLNTDGFLNSVSFLFIGLTLYVYRKAPTIKLRWIWALVGVSVLLGCGKLGAVILLPLLLLPMSKLPSKKWAGLLAVGGILAVAVNVGWTVLALPSSRYATGTSHDPSNMATSVLSHLDSFLIGFVQSLMASFNTYFHNWMASYGYWVGVVPPAVYWFCTILLILTVLIAEPTSEKFPIKASMFSLGLFLFASAAIIGLYFAVHYTPGELSDIRQGRYSIPHVPLFFIAICGLIPLRQSWKKLIEIAAVGCLLLGLGYYSFGLYAAYYTDCGYPAYVGGKCTLPIYKNLEVGSAPEIKVTAKAPVSQKFTALCNGLEAVQIIVHSVPKGTKGTLRFTLLDANQQKITASDFPASQITLGEQLTLPVSLPSSAKGTLYEIRLEASGVAAPDGFGILYQTEDAYDGEFSIGGVPFKSDLILHYICTNP